LYLDEDNIYHQDIYQNMDANPLLGIVGGMQLISSVVPLVIMQWSFQ